MPLYQYQAFDQAGVLRKGSEDAVSESDLRQRLRSLPSGLEITGRCPDALSLFGSRLT